MPDFIKREMRQRRIKPFILTTSANILKNEFGRLPDGETVYKAISLYGGVASLSFIKWVADDEIIEELTASTLRIGEKQFRYLDQLTKTKRLKAARFFVGSMMVEVDKKKAKYNYAERYQKTAEENDWTSVIVNNHSKVILMRTANNYYVLETSSNLNENPKIEQYSFENNKELYDFYYEFFRQLEEVNGE